VSKITKGFLILLAALLVVGGIMVYWSSGLEGNWRGSVQLHIGVYILALATIGIVFGIIEFAVLRLIGISPLGAIARVTFYEALFQPFSMILLGIGTLSITLFAFLPFFTLSEDAKMYRDVAMSFAMIFTLPIMVFAASKTVDEEIENRTMLTLMSKPVARWQVVIGKFAGVLTVVFACVAVLSIIAAACAYLRYFADYRVDYVTQNTIEGWRDLDLKNNKAVLALLPAAIQSFLSLAMLAAVSVAVSTRFSLVLNIVIIVVVYVFANLARYAGLLSSQDFVELGGWPMHAFITVPLLIVIGAWRMLPGRKTALLLATVALMGLLHWLLFSVAGITVNWSAPAHALARVLPALGTLDISSRLLYGQYTLGSEEPINGVPTYAQIWQYVGMSALYAIIYIGAALSFGIAAFRTRELT